MVTETETQVLAATDFARAKDSLSQIMTAVVHEHRPRVVQRHRGKEAMVLIGEDDLVLFLQDFRFDPKLVVDEGAVTAALSDFGLLGYGSNDEEAMEDLVRELQAYAQDFFDRYSFYRETDRARHAPWLLRFASTPPDGRLELLYEDAAFNARQAFEARAAQEAGVGA